MAFFTQPYLYKGFEIRSAKKTGGKAGKGYNKTTTWQVIDKGENRILKMFRWDVNSYESAKKAFEKAKLFIDRLEA